MTTEAPSRANLAAVALPKPDAAPVIMHLRPANILELILLLLSWP